MQKNAETSYSKNIWVDAHHEGFRILKYIALVVIIFNVILFCIIGFVRATRETIDLRNMAGPEIIQNGTAKPSGR
jgi:hypothetical protein